MIEPEPEAHSRSYDPKVVDVTYTRRPEHFLTSCNMTFGRFNLCFGLQVSFHTPYVDGPFGFGVLLIASSYVL